jgi:hypothetical protein
LTLFAAVLYAACATTKASPVRTPEQKEEIQNLLQSVKLIECRLASRAWSIPGDVTQAQVFKENNHWTLIYEALLRTGPRTVYQPIGLDFLFNGDGIAMGLREAPKVSDLKSFEDLSRNRWFTSRTKLGRSELYSGLVEVIVKGQNRRTLLPVPANESVQQMWPSLPAPPGLMNIIVRTTSSDDSMMSQDDQSMFRWYQVGLNEKSARLIATYKPKGEDLQPSGFVSLEKTGEPIAVGIVQPKIALADVAVRRIDGISKISLRRLFHPQAAERVIFSGQGHISGLTLSDPSFQSSMHLAWIFSPQRGGQRFLQTTSFPVKLIPERYFNRGPLKEAEPLLATEIAYEANNPDFSFTSNNQNQIIPVLGWWAKLENDVALLAQVITPAFRQTRGLNLKAADGTQLGVKFQPSLAIIAPTSYKRVLFFTAAPTQSDKSLMLLSNRNDSAEIAKESEIYPCLF